MALKERTSEFNSIVQGLKQKKSNIPSAIGGRNKSKKISEKSQFFAIASQIGRDIGETAEKLDRLAKLAKKKSIFDDPAIEIQELTSIINQDIKNLNNQITLLHERNNAKKGNQLQTHSDTILNSLKLRLRTTTKDFGEVLEKRTINLKAQQKERENFTGNSSPASTFSTQRRIPDSPLYASPYSPDATSDGGGGVAISMPQASQLTLTTLDNRAMNSRLDAVRNIEINITELKGIFQQLATMVVEQGELIERIDDNVNNSVANVNSAQNELLKYLNSVSSNRWLIIKLFLVLIFFVVLFIVFFV